MKLKKSSPRECCADYALTPEATLAELRQSYPALPDDALNTVLTAGFADWRLVKGELHFQNDAVANIRKTMSPCLAHSVSRQPSDGRHSWSDENMPILARERGTPLFLPHSGGTFGKGCVHRPSEMLTVHLPYPAQTETQTEIQLLNASHEGYISHAPHRTICFHAKSEIGQVFFVEFSYVSSARYTALDPAVVTDEVTGARGRSGRALSAHPLHPLSACAGCRAWRG